MSANTLYDKLWQSHIVHQEADGTALIYIDRHLVHEVTSPQAFEGLRLAGRTPWRKNSILATADHNTPTKNRDKIDDPISRLQVETLDDNIHAFKINNYFPMRDGRQGIVHVIGPEQGATLPGMTVVCGDSHTSTHGAFAALAFGIGTSEVEHVLATQCLLAKKTKAMLVKIDGKLGKGVTAKDVALAVIGKIGTAGGTGYAIEFGGETIRSLSMEGRMTICNMAIEAGARAGMVAADDTTINYVKGRPFAPIVPAVSGVTAEQASWKDSTGNHSIGQLVSHLAFWNERVLKAFQGNTPPDFTGNNEVTFKQLSKEEWDTVRNKLDTIQLKLEQMVEKASDEQLEEWCGTISNLAMHNAYHTGQIVYIRKKNGWWKNPK